MSGPADIQALDALVDWMRKRGVLTLETADGTRLELGSEPHAPPPPDTAIPEEQAAAAGEEILRRMRLDDEVIDNMASEGIPPGWSLGH